MTAEVVHLTVNGRDRQGLVEPRKTLAGQQIYASLLDKATAMSYSILQNRPFVDGNKRVGHAAMETFLVLNGTEITAPVDEQERLMLDLGAGRVSRGLLTDWLRQYVKPSA